MHSNKKQTIKCIFRNPFYASLENYFCLLMFFTYMLFFQHGFLFTQGICSKKEMRQGIWSTIKKSEKNMRKTEMVLLTPYSKTSNFTCLSIYIIFAQDSPKADKVKEYKLEIFRVKTVPCIIRPSWFPVYLHGVRSKIQFVQVLGLNQNRLFQNILCYLTKL